MDIVKLYGDFGACFRLDAVGTAISWGRLNEFGQLGHGDCCLKRVKPGAVRGLPALYRPGELDPHVIVSLTLLFAV